MSALSPNSFSLSLARILHPFARRVSLTSLLSSPYFPFHQSGNPCPPIRETTRTTTTPSLSSSDETDPPPSLLEPRRLREVFDLPRGISTRLTRRSGSTETVRTANRSRPVRSLARRLVLSRFCFVVSSFSLVLSSCETHLA